MVYDLDAIPTLLEILHDEQAIGYARANAASMLANLALLHPDDEELRAQVIAALRANLPPLQEDGTLALPRKITDDHYFVWPFLVDELTRLNDHGSTEQILTLYKSNLIDESVIGDANSYLNRLAKPTSLSKILQPTDTLAHFEMLIERERQEAEWRAQYEEQSRQKAEQQARRAEQMEQEGEERRRAAQQSQPSMPKRETIVRNERKVGRNEPCPCGSGKKYKKCCGR
jgi:hypothetical protein